MEIRKLKAIGQCNTWLMATHPAHLRQRRAPKGRVHWQTACQPLPDLYPPPCSYYLWNAHVLFSQCFVCLHRGCHPTSFGDFTHMPSVEIRYVHTFWCCKSVALIYLSVSLFWFVCKSGPRMLSVADNQSWMPQCPLDTHSCFCKTSMQKIVFAMAPGWFWSMLTPKSSSAAFWQELMEERKSSFPHDSWALQQRLRSCPLSFNVINSQVDH